MADPYFGDLARLQRDDGSFRSLPQDATLSETNTTAYALSIFAFLGFDIAQPAAARAAEYLLSRQSEDRSWPLPPNRGNATGYDSVPLQTAIPLRGLCAVGLAREAAVERGLQNLLDLRLPDGAWPTGRAQGTLGHVAGYRRLPQSRWGCRSNTTGAVAALSGHPDLATADAARRERLSAPEKALATDRVHPAAAAWITYAIEWSRAHLTGDWVGSEIHTPYSSYPRDPKRF